MTEAVHPGIQSPSSEGEPSRAQEAPQIQTHSFESTSQHGSIPTQDSPRIVELIGEIGPQALNPEGVVWEKGRDNVVTPAFSEALMATANAEKNKALTKLGSALAARESIMRTADFYLKEGAIEYPEGFQEPPPYALSAEEWAKYSARKSVIERERHRLERAKLRVFHPERSADYYLTEGMTDLPFDFKEPEPFILDAEEYAIYAERRAKIA